MVRHYTLNFSGPFALLGTSDPTIFAVPFSKQSGVYLWIVPYVRGGHIVTYVGETTVSFGQRMKEHMIQTIGGNYRISDADLLCQGVDHVLWDGLWRKGTREKVGEYVTRFIEFGPAIQKMLGTIRVLVAPVESEDRMRRRIEGALANHIKTQPAPASSLLPGDIRYYGRRPNEVSTSVQVSCDVDVLGLPSVFEA